MKPYTNIKLSQICECGYNENYYLYPDGYIICPQCGLIQQNIYQPNNLLSDILEAEQKQHNEDIKYMAWLNSTLH